MSLLVILDSNGHASVIAPNDQPAALRIGEARRST